MAHPVAQPPGFENLSTLEKVRYLQDLWDQISADPEDVPILESHLDVVEQRIAEHRANPQPMRSGDEVLDELDALDDEMQ